MRNTRQPSFFKQSLGSEPQIIFHERAIMGERWHGGFLFLSSLSFAHQTLKTSGDLVHRQNASHLDKEEMIHNAELFGRHYQNTNLFFFFFFNYSKTTK